VAKGLEFPIVCCPTLWCNPKAPAVIYQDPLTGRRTFDVTRGQPWPDAGAAGTRTLLAAQEAVGERLRLLYVALTRARHHTIVWWSEGPGSNGTALARVLFARVDGAIDPDMFHADTVRLPDDDAVLTALAPLVERSEGNIAAGIHGDSPRPLIRWVEPGSEAAAPVLELSRLRRVPDRCRSRWSFTAMTQAARAASFDPYDASLADRGAHDESADDETGEPEVAPGGGGPRTEPVVPAMARLPAGAEFGTLVHGILERIDFTSPDLEADLRREVDRSILRVPFDLTTDAVGIPGGPGEDVLVAGLVDVLTAPLGAPIGDLRLRDLAPGDRINEMSFELSVGEAGTRATLRDVGRLVCEHLNPDDPFMAWARRLADGRAALVLAGHLTGSIDLVFRAPDRTGRSRYMVADYKTNRLSGRGRPPRPGEYGRLPMARAMAEHDYPLQALLYSVALHRYLRWRVPGYDPSLDLGGAVYLFVRGMEAGMVGGTDGHRDGVFHWGIPPRLVDALSQLLDGRARVDGAA
jgi:exodeoxyribonuclease V beta subunit